MSKRQSFIRQAHRGTYIVQMAGIILLVLMTATFGVDMAAYFGAQNQLQTAADSAALAAARELVLSEESDPDHKLADAENVAINFAGMNMNGAAIDTSDVTFGFIDPGTGIYDESVFDIPDNGSFEGTNGFNAIRVVAERSDASVSGPLSTLLARMVGINEMSTAAMAITMFEEEGGIVSTNGSGVRPIYVCEGQLDYANSDGNIENNTVRIYGSHVTVDGQASFSNCPPPTSGNWGFADLRDCGSGSVGASTIREWFANGYPGTVEAGQCYSTKPGNFIASIRSELDQLIADETVITVPLYDGFGGSGSNTNVDVSGFSGFVISGYRSNGNAASRYIEGHFTKVICTSGCQSAPDQDTTGSAVLHTRKAALH